MKYILIVFEVIVSFCLGLFTSEAWMFRTVFGVVLIYGPVLINYYVVEIHNDNRICNNTQKITLILRKQAKNNSFNCLIDTSLIILAYTLSNNIVQKYTLYVLVILMLSIVNLFILECFGDILKLLFGEISSAIIIFCIAFTGVFLPEFWLCFTTTILNLNFGFWARAYLVSFLFYIYFLYLLKGKRI